MSHGTPAQEQTFGLDLKITCNGYTKRGARFKINGDKLQAASAMKRPQLNVLTTAEYKKLERKFKK